VDDPTPAQYEQRYCAFVDILGFSELIGRLAQGATPVDALRKLLGTVHAEPTGKNIKSFKQSDLKAQSISDALCLSSACTPAGLGHLFHNLEELSRHLLKDGFFIRGAVVKGMLYHDEKIAFGDALVRAYRLEQDVVRYARIMATRDVAVDVEKYLDEFDFGELLDSLKQADDGPYFLHVLNLWEVICENEDKPIHRQPYIKECNHVAAQIKRRFDESVDNPRHFEKVQWFAKYWNRTFERYQDVNQIEGPGLAREPAVWR
jgi:hypothetical protein